jgi:hypothetical protein
MKKVYTLLGLIIIIFVTGIAIVKANPSYFSPGAATAAATTTVVYMTPGTATTTLYYDTYNSGNTQKTNAATVLTQFNGSSTSAILGIAVEYAQGDGTFDCDATPAACDWYQNATIGQLAGWSTTTATQDIATVKKFSWQYVATPAGGAAGTAATTTRAVVVDTPTRYMRVIYTMTGANGAIWAQVVPNKERLE